MGFSAPLGEKVSGGTLQTFGCERHLDFFFPGGGEASAPGFVWLSCVRAVCHAAPAPRWSDVNGTRLNVFMGIFFCVFYSRIICSESPRKTRQLPLRGIVPKQHTI